MVAWILLVVFGASMAAGVVTMIVGSRANLRSHSRRDRPGDRLINTGLLVTILSGMALVAAGWAILTWR